MGSVPRSLLSIVNSAYETNGPIDDWVRTIVEAASPELDRGLGMMGMTFRVGDGRLLLTSRLITAGSVPTSIADVAQIAPSVDLLACLPCAKTLYSPWAEPRALDSASAAQARSNPDRSYAKMPAFEFARSIGIRDHLVAKAVDPSGNGCLLWAGTPEETTVPNRRARAWSRVMAHLLAALRLRTALEAHTEAVVEPGGRVLHAEGVATHESAREALRHAAIHVDRVRTRAGAREAETALERWHALVSGRWSLVDSFESDGRRYLVARKNDPELQLPCELSQRERQIVAYAALGHPNKYIAYVLGLAPSTVSSHLVSAMKRLSVKSRAELARVWAFESND